MLLVIWMNQMDKGTEDILINKLIAAGGWVRRGMDKQKVLSIFRAEHALREAMELIESAIEILRGPQDGKHDP
jgi:hypothetical protein